MKAILRRICVWLVCSVPVAGLAAAPAMPGVERLPADTWVLLQWHGVTAADRVRGTNPVMRLWDDPQIKAVRAGLLEDLARENSAFNQARADDVLSVLENPALIGMAGDPMAVASGGGRIHGFAVINRKGKEAAWARLRQESTAKPGAVESTYSFSGLLVKKTVTTTPAPPAPEGMTQGPPQVRESFSALLGDYELFADQQQLMETLITRLQARSAPAGASLASNATFQRAQRFRADGPLLEAFVKMPDLGRLPIPQQQQIDIAAGVRELHLERMHGLWLSAGMGSDRMVMRGALLADTAPGGLLDVIGGNVKEFQTAAVASAEGSFGAVRLDLPALYATLLRAVRSGLPPDQGAAAGILIDSVVAAQTGMRATELLSLLGGEIGTSSVGEGMIGGSVPGMLLFQVARSEPLLGLLQMMTSSFSQGEERIGAATVLKLLTPQTGAAAAAVEPQPVLVAVAPKTLAVTQDRKELEAALAREATGAAAPAGSVAADPAYLAMRRTLPAELNAVSFANIASGHWEKEFDGLRKTLRTQQEEVRKRLAEAGAPAAGDATSAQQAAQLRAQLSTLEKAEQTADVVIPLLAKYLKLSAGGGWKAADGVFFDSYVN